MANFANIIVLFLVVAMVAVHCAQPPSRYRQVRKFQQIKRRPLRLQPIRKLARQQEPVTPYPTAEELIPEVPFEEGHTPDEVYGPPDETYGPPEEELAGVDQLPSEEAPEDFAPHPDVEEFEPTEQLEELKELEQIARLRKTSNKKTTNSRVVEKKKTQKSQRIITEPIIAAPATLPIASPFAAINQPYFVVNQQPFAYSAQYQVW